MQVTERVDKSGLKKQLKLAALLIGISGRPPVSVRVDQIDVTAGHVQVTAHYYRLLLVERHDIFTETALPCHTIVNALQSLL